jgi:hypothetical protein
MLFRVRPGPPRCAQLAALPDAEMRRFLADLAGCNVEAMELPLAGFLAELAVQAERDGR